MEFGLKSVIVKIVEMWKTRNPESGMGNGTGTGTGTGTRTGTRQIRTGDVFPVRFLDSGFHVFHTPKMTGFIWTGNLMLTVVRSLI